MRSVFHFQFERRANGSRANCDQLRSSEIRAGIRCLQLHLSVDSTTTRMHSGPASTRHSTACLPCFRRVVRRVGLHPMSPVLAEFDVSVSEDSTRFSSSREPTFKNRPHLTIKHEDFHHLPPFSPLPNLSRDVSRPSRSRCHSAP